MKVGYQGIGGAYSEVACLQFFGEDVQAVGYEHFKAAIAALKKDEVDAIALPVENSTTGIIFLTMDLMRSEQNLHAVGETYVTVDHHLMVREYTPLDKLHRAYSHTEALKQCSNFLKSHHILANSYDDTASAALYVSRFGKPGECAIASKRAAELYGLTLIKSHIQDIAGNTTRFLILSKETSPLADKTTLYFETGHHPGALVEILNLFKEEHINMTSLNSRPAMNQSLFEYGFFVEVSANLFASEYRHIQDQIRSSCTYVNFMGAYTSEKNR